MVFIFSSSVTQGMMLFNPGAGSINPLNLTGLILMGEPRSMIYGYALADWRCSFSFNKLALSEKWKKKNFCLQEPYCYAVKLIFPLRVARKSKCKPSQILNVSTSELSQISILTPISSEQFSFSLV